MNWFNFQEIQEQRYSLECQSLVPIGRVIHMLREAYIHLHTHIPIHTHAHKLRTSKRRDLMKT